MNAGLKIKRVEIDKTGKIVLFTGAAGEPTSANEWDEVAKSNSDILNTLTDSSITMAHRVCICVYRAASACRCPGCHGPRSSWRRARRRWRAIGRRRHWAPAEPRLAPSMRRSISYYQSTAFVEGLAEGTRKSRRAILERFRNEHGDKRIALLHKSALQAILNKRSAAATKNWKKALRGLLDHCLSLDMIATDPLAGINLTKVKSKPHRRWTPADIEKYKQRHPRGTKARLALELILSTGQARCDVVRMGRQFVEAGTLSMNRQKTGVAFDIPVLPSLSAELDLQSQSDRHLTFLVTEQGKPFTAAGFGSWFRDRCDEAGLPLCAAHGLRSAAATRLADHGATAHQLMSWFGWRTLSEAERYTKEADRKRLAAEAGRLIARTGIGKPEIQFAKKRR
ncbi:tyrosine-type recombinase/integrase [Bradyrhizobium sp. sBnM-33]|uniref:tyrosine-type recombinase/integrase n=2 Tax=Bradyrhizobium sp. sBnM-33 TaxID=2831780 RepID=UPI00293F345E|nr:tyrosine-type recombinase/integrase [Bradyrhizobium sp. sBnM-33]WOH53837.1 tyrosine-type recombinase/integrase [Bradyrhizobium sp. sBnM-33]